MKKLSLVILFAISIMACKNETKTESTKVDEVSKDDITTSIYPENISKVFDAHGGIDQWNRMKMLSFTMEKPNGQEVTTVDLRTRSELIDTPDYTQIFNGDSIWIKEKNEKEYKGNARFYRGLMMYFYAMPFVLGDDGINYEKAIPLTFEGKTYPGIMVSYESGIGSSPDDQYIVYYDEASGKMQWLGYTVTFGKGEKSKDFHFIRYNNWQTVNGLVVPKSIDWYKFENDQLTEKRNTVEFTNVVLTEDAPDESMFSKPEGAKTIN